MEISTKKGGRLAFVLRTFSADSLWIVCGALPERGYRQQLPRSHPTEVGDWACARANFFVLHRLTAALEKPGRTVTAFGA